MTYGDAYRDQIKYVKEQERPISNIASIREKIDLHEIYRSYTSAHRPINRCFVDIHWEKTKDIVLTISKHQISHPSTFWVPLP